MVDKILLDEVRDFLQDFQLGERLVDIGANRLLWLLCAYLVKKGYQYRREFVYAALCSCLGAMPTFYFKETSPYLPAPAHHSQSFSTLNSGSLSTTISGATSSVDMPEAIHIKPM